MEEFCELKKNGWCWSANISSGRKGLSFEAELQTCYWKDRFGKGGTTSLTKIRVRQYPATNSLLGRCTVDSPGLRGNVCPIHRIQFELL